MDSSKRPLFRFLSITVSLILLFLTIRVPGSTGPSAVSTAQAANTLPGLVGQMAPEIHLSSWIDGNGYKTEPIRLSDHRGKVIYLYFFQDWWPGCQKVGFPTLKKLSDTFKKNKNVVFLGIQTVFEGFSINTEDKLRKNQKKFDLKIPMAHATGGQQSHHIPDIMKDYHSRGTPWTVIIDTSGKVVFNNFHIDAAPAVALIENLLQENQ